MAEAAPGGASDEDVVPYLKTRLLASVAGLDRGFAATGRQVCSLPSLLLILSDIMWQDERNTLGFPLWSCTMLTLPPCKVSFTRLSYDAQVFTFCPPL